MNSKLIDTPVPENAHPYIEDFGMRQKKELYKGFSKRFKKNAFILYVVSYFGGFLCGMICLWIILTNLEVV